MGRDGLSRAARMRFLPQVALATLIVTVLPGLVAGALHAGGAIRSWLLSSLLAVGLSIALMAAGSAWWPRRSPSRDIVFAELMLWGWLRRLRTERRVASARRLLGQPAGVDPARRVELLVRLAAALEARDPDTHGHSRRVARHAHAIARELGLGPELVARIRTAAALHDVGKLETPRELLVKPGRLTADEFEVIKRHPVDGAQMVTPLGDEELTAIVRHHHERLDGRGYPDRLGDDRIPLGARVIAVADTFDALTSNRAYRAGCRHKQALDVIRAEAGRQLDPAAVTAFVSYYSGRRVLPWWSAVAAVPSRLAAWALSGIQGGAPVGGLAALGAAFVVSAGLPLGSGEAGRPAEAKAAVGD
ncbi:MAG: HD-GYP domain-containing protein, partial [Thermoleophilaceae bacterium]